MDDARMPLDTDLEPSRREFTVGAAVVGVAVAGVAGAAEAAPMEVVETEVVIKTADGDCDAAFYHPSGKGSWPGVIIAPDALGLRPVYREMAKRIAAQGYTVLVPNPFYRMAKAPVLPADFDIAKPADRAKLGPLMGPLTPDVVSRDSVAFVTFIDAQPQTSKKKKLGISGYCMGGPVVMRTAAANPDRIGAICSFHGGGLVTDTPASPHLLIPQSKAAVYHGVASNDDKNQPTAKDVLKASYEAAKLPAIVTVYAGAMHGWTMKDFAVYNEPSAEIAFANMMAHWKQHLG